MDLSDPSPSEADTDELTDALAEAIEAEALASTENAETVETAQLVSQDSFEALARETVTGMGGVLLFSICVGPEQERRHVATARLGEGEAQEFIVLSMPAAGGDIKAEPASTSADPVACIAAAYAGLAEALAAAA